jgi:hypothetical protein
LVSEVRLGESTYELGLVDTNPGLILTIAAQIGFRDLLVRRYVSE